MVFESVDGESRGGGGDVAGIGSQDRFYEFERAFVLKSGIEFVLEFILGFWEIVIPASSIFFLREDSTLSTSLLLMRGLKRGLTVPEGLTAVWEGEREGLGGRVPGLVFDSRRKKAETRRNRTAITPPMIKAFLLRRGLCPRGACCSSCFSMNIFLLHMY